jgi:tryptophan halogenase
MKKFIILGGGSAGWITALSIKKTFPDCNVTVIQSSTVGIIGVGEATTPHVVNFLKDIGIDPLDVVKKTSGSIKNGISFENWNGDGKRYFHSFYERIAEFSVPNIFESQASDYYKKVLISNNLPFEEHIYQTKLAYSNKVDLINTNYALHFDATKFASYLEQVGRELGVTVIEGNYKHCSQNEQGFITALHLDNNCTLDCDFVFDCTGFARLLIGNVFKEKWRSFSNFLPAKKAIPFWLASENDIVPYTGSIAMKYGWMWKIPLQHRIGSGYVFDSDYISVDQAHQEAEQHYQRPLKINKIIDFDPGRYENVWVKNCMAVGLSSSFLEPLESTSLWLTITQLTLFKHFINELEAPRSSSLTLFNKMIANEIDDKAHFVYIHYLTKRKDSDFWINFREKCPVPDALKEKLELIKESNLRHFNISNAQAPAIFPLHSYLEVCNGLEMYENKMNISNYETIKPSPAEYKLKIQEALSRAPTHLELLTHLQKT